MTRTDQQLIFTALGFMAVLMRGEIDQNDSAKRARGIAWLIEEFCLNSQSSNIGDAKDCFSDDLTDNQVDGLIDNFKATLRDKGEATLPEDRQTLLKIHQRLEERIQNKARQSFSAETLSDLILQLIDVEIDEEGAAA
ncbi:MAG: hypothetical protein PHX43_01060 [Alphaproteobacteria bacterium]|nr:hypothetical protein [Alphaproteobacteria bacterium]